MPVLQYARYQNLTFWEHFHLDSHCHDKISLRNAMGQEWQKRS